MSDDLSNDLYQEIKVGDWIAADDDDPSLPSGRVPHFGHAVLFLITAGFLLIATQAVLLSPYLKEGNPLTLAFKHPKLILASEALSYLLTLTISWFLFPLLWHRSFLAGISWNGGEARRLLLKLIPVGIFTGWTVQAISSLISMPKSVPMDDFFRSPGDVWLVTAFGTLLAPLFEEIAFRGFLLPAFSIAFDWLGAWCHYLMQFSQQRLHGEMPQHYPVLFPESRIAALTPGTGNLAFRSTTALILSSLVTSALFGLLHAQQLGYTWPAVLLLSGVSLLLTYVRYRTRSVACSTIVHSCYNLSVFLLLFIATGGYRHLDRMGH